MLLLLLSACSSIDYKSAPTDWPKLKVDVREVSEVEIAKRCRKYAALPIACAEVFFQTYTCVIWIAPGAAQWVKDHEMAHCWGYSHVGETTLADAWAAWKGR